jgi:hypothetical protein
VQGLVPPVVCRNAEPVDRGRVIHQLGNPLFDCHAGEQIVDALVHGRVRIRVYRGILRGGARSENGNHQRAGARQAQVSKTHALFYRFTPDVFCVMLMAYDSADAETRTETGHKKGDPS